MANVYDPKHVPKIYKGGFQEQSYFKNLKYLSYHGMSFENDYKGLPVMIKPLNSFNCSSVG